MDRLLVPRLLVIGAAGGVVLGAVGAWLQAGADSPGWLSAVGWGIAGVGVILLLGLVVRTTLRSSSQNLKTRGLVKDLVSAQKAMRAEGLAEVGRHQAALDEVRKSISELAGAMTGVLRTVEEDNAELRSALASALRGSTTEIAHETERLRAVINESSAAADLAATVDGASDRLFAQIEAVVALYSTAELRFPLPTMSGWALSPEAAVDLVQRVADRRPTTVVECGSGLSTVVLAHAQRSLGIDGRVIALEHDEHYAHLTRELLVRHGLTERATVLHAPLVDVQVEGVAYRWYDLSGLADVTAIDLLFVDGPPAKVGANARFPAYPLLRNRLSADAAVVLDDANRPDEEKIVHAWLAFDGDLRASRFATTRGTAVLTRVDAGESA